MPKKLQKRLQDYLTKIKKPPPQIRFPSKKWIRTCKHPKTLSFAINRDSNAAHQDKDDDEDDDAATLSDIDEFLFENFRSLYLRDDQGGTTTTTDVDDEIREAKGLPPPPSHAFRDKTLFLKEGCRGDHHENESITETFWDKSVHTKKHLPDYQETQIPSDGFMFESPRLNIDPPAADLCGSHRFSVSPGRLSSSVRTSTTTTTSEDAGSTSMSSHSNNNDHMQAKDVPLPSDCISVLMYSPNPCDDFRRSMLDMVEARIRNKANVDWNFMEELLFCYLNLNEKKSHKFILSAFADLVVDMRGDSDRAPARSRKR